MTSTNKDDEDDECKVHAILTTELFYESLCTHYLSLQLLLRDYTEKSSGSCSDGSPKDINPCIIFRFLAYHKCHISLPTFLYE